jgi:hypothetical protein
LRKLLLWTAVVAVLLGIATTLGEVAAGLVCWTIPVCAIRCAFGPKVAGVLSLAAAVILSVSFSCLFYMTSHPHAASAEAAIAAVIGGGTVGGLFGLATFGIVEGAVRGVNWVDKVLETKSDGRD